MASAEPRLWRSNAAASPQLHIWGLGTAALAEDSLRRPAAIPHVVPSYQRTIAVASARLRRTIALASSWLRRPRTISRAGPRQQRTVGSFLLKSPGGGKLLREFLLGPASGEPLREIR